MCDVYNDDYATVWSPETRKARIEHRCGACGGKIKAGRKYVRLFTLFDGQKDSTKCCMPCWMAVQRFAKAHNNFQPHPTAIADSLQDCIDEEPESASQWRGLLRGMRQRREAAYAAVQP